MCLADVLPATEGGSSRIQLLGEREGNRHGRFARRSRWVFGKMELNSKFVTQFYMLQPMLPSKGVPIPKIPMLSGPRSIECKSM